MRHDRQYDALAKWWVGVFVWAPALIGIAVVLGYGLLPYFFL